jgi:hypothetical protein
MWPSASAFQQDNRNISHNAVETSSKVTVQVAELGIRIAFPLYILTKKIYIKISDDRPQPY